MVYAVVVHTLQPGRCKILYSCSFGVTAQLSSDSECIDSTVSSTPTESPVLGQVLRQDGADSPEANAPSSESLVHHRKQQLSALAEEVQSQYVFRSTAAAGLRSYDRDLQRLVNEGTLPDLELGYFSVPPGDLSAQSRVLLWMGAVNCGFSLLLEESENRLLAESLLKVLIRLLHEHCRVFAHPTELLSNPDRADLVVRHLLPGGKLLLMNHRLLRQTEKELDARLKALT